MNVWIVFVCLYFLFAVLVEYRACRGIVRCDISGIIDSELMYAAMPPEMDRVELAGAAVPLG